MACSSENGIASRHNLDIDVKTEAAEIEEDYDTSWNDGIPDTGEMSDSDLNIASSQQEMEATNGINGTDHLGDLTNFEDFPPVVVKMEPDSHDEDLDLDSTRSRFNLRKRKPSFNSDMDSPPFISTEVERGDGDESIIKPKKQRKKVIYNYTTNTLHEALDLVQSQNISIMNAAKQYGIPRSTLRRYALTVWAAAAPKTKNRPETALTPPEEAHLVSMITKMSRAGKYVSTMDVKSTVQHLLDESQRIVFKDRNRPNAGWVQRFRKRHRNLEIKGSGYTPKKQTPLTIQEIVEWNNEITQYLITDWEINPNEFFVEENAHRIFNLDETALVLNVKQDLLEENVPPIPKSEEEASEVTILAGVSAAGEFLQPLIIQKGEGGGHEEDIMPLDQNSYGISFSLSGKMNSEIFLRWLEAFDRELMEKEVQKPIVIFLDDVFAHFHISVFNYSIDSDIILLCIPSQGGSIMQPVEAEINERVKVSYRAFSREHYKMECQPVTLDQFPVTFLSAWETVKDAEGMKEKVKRSFTNYGLMPLNPHARGVLEVVSSGESTQKEAVKLDLKTKLPKEPKAKKTVALKKQRARPHSPGMALPIIKIKKIEKSPTEVFPIISSNSSSLYGEIPEKLSPVFDPLAFAEPILAKLEDYIPLPSVKAKKSSRSITNNKMDLLSQERLVGRQDGIKKCLDLMESFVPPDIIPIWRSRTEDLKSTAEIPYSMWKAVNNMLNEMTSQIERKRKKSPKFPKGSKAKGNMVNISPTKDMTPEDFLRQINLIQCDPLEI